MSDRTNLAALANGPTRRQAIAGVAMAFGGLAWAQLRLGREPRRRFLIRRNPFTRRLFSKRAGSASTKRSLTPNSSTRSYSSVESCSPCTWPDKPAEISREVGGAFTLFGGYITGRHIELVPNERIVQAWRAGGWDPGIYSIARFELVEQGSGTKIVFDHTGFPKGEAEAWLRDGKRTIGSRSKTPELGVAHNARPKSSEMTRYSTKFAAQIAVVGLPTRGGCLAHAISMGLLFCLSLCPIFAVLVGRAHTKRFRDSHHRLTYSGEPVPVTTYIHHSCASTDQDEPMRYGRSTCVYAQSSDLHLVDGGCFRRTLRDDRDRNARRKTIPVSSELPLESAPALRSEANVVR